LAFGDRALHASYASAAAYVEGDGTAAGTKLLEKAANPPQATAGVVANLLFIASVGFNKTLTGQPWAGRLGEVHARRGIAIAGAGRAKS
jgi:hypothetical protein